MRVLVDAQVLKILLTGAGEVNLVEDLVGRPPIADVQKDEVAEAEDRHDGVVERHAHGRQAFSRVEPMPRTRLCAACAAAGRLRGPSRAAPSSTGTVSAPPRY